MINFVQEGARMDYTPGSAVAIGVGVIVGTAFGVTTEAIAASTLGSLAVEGVFSFVKTGGGGIAFVQGAKVYFNEGTQLATATDTDMLIGLATAASVDADTSVNVRLQPQGA